MTSLLVLALIASTPDASPRRFGLFIASNSGDADEERLRYANEDALRMMQVLTELGGLKAEDSVLLLDADGPTVQRAIGTLRKRLSKEAAAQDQLFIYVSSHADEGALHLSGSHVPLRELISLTEEAPLAVALLVVDSCRSGAATRPKGLKPLSGTSVSLEAPDVSGRVVISSSGPDELSQESDRIRGSFFTHHWVAGLRGAADTSGDARVTLEEAYAYAYTRTVESTFATAAGIQHPAFRIDLRGQGSLVLTAIEAARSKLRIDVERAGTWVILSEPGDRMVSELTKSKGSASLALGPGTYQVQERISERLRRATVEVPISGEGVVHEGDLLESDLVATSAKGAQTTSWDVSAGPQVGVAAVGGMSVAAGLRTSAQLERRWWGPVDAIGLALAYRQATATGAIPFSEREWDVSARAACGWSRGRVRGQVGLDVGATVIRQTQLQSTSARTGLEPRLQLSTQGRLRLMGPVALFVEVAAGPGVVREPSGPTLRWDALASCGIAVLQ